MPIERNLEDPRTDAELIRRRTDPNDDNSQEDIQLDQRPRPQGRVALLAVALVALFGIIAYSMTSKPVPPDARPVAQTAPASPGTTAQVPRAPIGQTTGSASSRPATPPTTSDTNAAPAAPQINGAPAAPSSN